MQPPKRSIETVRTELTDFILAIERSAEKARRTINQVNIISFHPALQHAIGLVAEEVSTILLQVPSIRRESNELYQRAITDGLTQLLNRGFFEDVLKQEVALSQNAAIIMTDIDRFGKYNNQYGHQQGDVALRSVADAIKQAAPVKTIARYGGEEFSIILAHYTGTRQEVSRVAERIRASVEQTILPAFSIDVISEQVAQKQNIPRRQVRNYFTQTATPEDYESILCSFFPRNRKLQNYLRKLQRITVSVGAAVKHKKEGVEHLIHRADEALYRAKKSGRNCAVLA